MKQDWEVRTLKDLSKIMYGHTTKVSTENEGLKYLRITDIQNGKVNWSSVPSFDYSEEIFEKYGLKYGDIVFARTGATTGKSYLIKNPPKSVFASYLIRVQTDLEILIPEFLKLFFESPYYWNEVSKGISGSAQGGFNAKKLGLLEIPIPPLPEQKRIVAKLDTAFEAIDKAITNTQQNLQNTQDLFQSKLNEIFTNTSTSSVPDNSSATEPVEPLTEPVEPLTEPVEPLTEPVEPLTEPVEPLTEPVEPLTEPVEVNSWVEKSLGDLTEVITKGSSPKWQGINYIDKNAEGILFVTSENVGSGSLIMKKRKYLEKRFNEKQKKSILKYGDVLTNIVGASIGRTAIFNLKEIANINQAVCLIRCNSQILFNEFLMHLLNSPVLLKILHSNEVNMARANLSLTFFKNLVIKYPSVEKQKQIVKEINNLKSKTDTLKTKYEQQLANLQELKKSILQQAFEGKL